MSFASLLILLFSGLISAKSVYVSNLDVTCLKCICTASTGCNEKYDCSPEGFCGPFFISKKYWEDADAITLNSTRLADDGGYKDCVKNFQCASRVVARYMANSGWDCTADGVTDCDDYSRIHFMGPERCDQPIENSLFYKRYTSCRPPKAVNDFSLLKK